MARLRRFRDWLGYQAWMLIPARFNESRLWWWLLPYAGAWAYREDE